LPDPCPAPLFRPLTQPKKRRRSSPPPAPPKQKQEKGGVGYKLAKWDGIFLEKGYIRCAGARSLSYTADGVSAIAGGGSTLGLEKEMDAQQRAREAAAGGGGGGGAAAAAHDRAGLVSLVVREAEARPVKERLVAVGGKLVTLTSQAGEAPNGSAFCITLGPAPDLDRTNLIVGRLVPGSAGSAATVAALAALPVNKPREGINKPFFDAGKAMGDSRAIVAERGFMRPLRRAIISDGGELL
jgi:peptidyl-prolyl cis-trans isomerase B (cyclophilin B)